MNKVTLINRTGAQRSGRKLCEKQCLLKNYKIQYFGCLQDIWNLRPSHSLTHLSHHLNIPCAQVKL